MPTVTKQLRLWVKAENYLETIDRDYNVLWLFLGCVLLFIFLVGVGVGFEMNICRKTVVDMFGCCLLLFIIFEFLISFLRFEFQLNKRGKQPLQSNL